jgi:hypothetical protein
MRTSGAPKSRRSRDAAEPSLKTMPARLPRQQPRQLRLAGTEGHGRFGNRQIAAVSSATHYPQTNKHHYLMTSPTRNQARVAKVTLYASATRTSRPHLVEFPRRRNGGNPFLLSEPLKSEHRCFLPLRREADLADRGLGARSGGLGSGEPAHRTATFKMCAQKLR